METRLERQVRAAPESGSGWYEALARTGIVAKGVSYGIVAVLAIELAAGVGGTAESREGALATLADESFGKILLVLLTMGFAAYAIWRFVQAVAERNEDGDAEGFAKTWGKRAGYIGRGAIYAALTYSTLRLLTGSSEQSSQSEKAKHTTATVLDWPAGRWLVGAAGIALVGAGAWNVYRGVAKKFEEKWTEPRSGPDRPWGRRAGVAGHIARGVVFGLVGAFLVKAAVEFDPKEAIGIDGALRKLANAPYGPYLLGLTAAGLLCYALFCLVDARYRDVSANRS